MGSARIPKAPVLKDSTSVVRLSGGSESVVCRGMVLASAGPRYRHDGAQQRRRGLLPGRKRQHP